MKIGIHDIQHIVTQVKRASPPLTKEMHKLINNLAILLEKNTTKLESPQEAVLTGHLERLNEAFLNLCFLRKELTVRYNEEYANEVAAALAVLRKNECLAASDTVQDCPVANWMLDSACGDFKEQIHEIFSNLHKAKAVIEDTLECSTVPIGAPDPDTYLESYLNGM